MAGHWGKDDMSTKSGNCAGRGWNDAEGATWWQITRKGGWGVAGHWDKDDMFTKSEKLCREGLGQGGAPRSFAFGTQRSFWVS